MDIQHAWNLLTDKLEQWLRDLILIFPNAILAFFVMIAFIVAARVIRTISHRILNKLSSRAAVNQLVGAVLYLAVLSIGLLVALSILKLDKAVMSLLAGLGVAGLALGFAFQDIASNFMSGLLIIITRPFKIGDIIQCADYFGVVESVSLRNSVIKTWDGQAVLIPNKEMFQSPITNFSMFKPRRVDLMVGVSYGDDLEKVKRVAIDAINKVEGRIEERATQLFFYEFGDSSINFSLHFWLPNSEQGAYLEARSQAVMAIKQAFDQNDITIPFPIRTLDFGIKGGATLSEMQPALSLVNRAAS